MTSPGELGRGTAGTASGSNLYAEPLGFSASCASLCFAWTSLLRLPCASVQRMRHLSRWRIGLLIAGIVFNVAEHCAEKVHRWELVWALKWTM